MDIGKSGDNETTNSDRRKKAGLPDNSKSGKFIINNWFRLVIIGFMVVFTYQLNEIHNDMNYIDSDDRVTVKYLSKDVVRTLEKIRDRK